MNTHRITWLLAAMVILLSVPFASAKEVPVIVEKNMGAMKVESHQLFSYENARTKAMTESEIKHMAEKLMDYTNSRFNLGDTQMEAVKGRLFWGGQKEYYPTAYLDIDPAQESFIFNKGMKNYMGEGTSRGLPDRSYAPRVAEKHLYALELLPKNFEEQMHLVHVGGVAMAALKEDGSTANYKKWVTVIYGRTLNGLPVKGASRIAVKMGINGELVGLVRSWPVLKKKAISSKHMIPTHYRMEHLKRHLQSLYANSNTEAVIITDVNIVMYDDGRGIIEPALFALGEIRLEDGSEEPADWMIPLLKRPNARYSILERVPVQPEASHMKEMRSPVLEDEAFDDEIL
jgi:hypothetical protein